MPYPIFFRKKGVTFDMGEDMVNHPSHYETDGIQCIDAMVAAQGADAVKEFCVCNAFKYIWRFRHKNGIEDIKKAVWYLNKRIELEDADFIQEVGEKAKEELNRQVDVQGLTWNDATEPDMFVCGKCGVYLDISDGNSSEPVIPGFCPVCGRKIDKNYWNLR